MGRPREYRKSSGLEAADKPLNSVPLRFDLTCADDLRPLALLLRDRALAVDKRAARPTTRAKLAEAFDLLLANLINAYRLSPRCFVGVSRSENDYITGRYQNRKIGFNNLKIAYDYLIDAGLVSFARGFNDRDKKRAFTSRMKPTGNLRLLFARYKRIVANKKHASNNLDSLFHRLLEHPIGDRIDIPQSWVRVLKPTEVIRLKAAKAKALSDYKDDRTTDRMRRRLTSWNNFAANHHLIDLLKPDLEIEKLFLHGDYDDEDDVASSFGDEIDRPSFVQFDRFTLYRVFNNGSFEEGGRFYGGWWQRIPKQARRYITINDKPTKEFDYSNLHAAMLYAKEGLPLGDDAYSLDGIDPEYRDLIKATFMRMINAKKDQKIQSPKKKLLPSGWSFAELQKAIKEKHGPIAKYMRTGIGLELQRVDADIAEDVMLSMMSKDYLALPIHDSFIVYSGLSDLVKSEMGRAYRKVMNSAVGIKADPTFLELELSRSPADEGDEVPAVLEEVERRALEPGYEGYRSRRDAFFRSRSEEWILRFGPGRGF